MLHQFRPGQELIVIKTPNPRLDVVKTVKGMSGSPIYLDGRLAGAYSYSLSRIRGRARRRRDPHRPDAHRDAPPIPPGFWPREGRAAPCPRAPPRGAAPARERPRVADDRFDGQPGAYDLAEHARQLAIASARPTRPAACVPGHDAAHDVGRGRPRPPRLSRKLVEPLGLEPLQGGGGDARRPRRQSTTSTVAGWACSSSAATSRSWASAPRRTSTGTARSGASGIRCSAAETNEIPASIGSVLWILASAQASPKIGECVRPLGTLVQDRMSAIVVDERARRPPSRSAFASTAPWARQRQHWHTPISKTTIHGAPVDVGHDRVRHRGHRRREARLTWHMHSAGDRRRTRRRGPTMTASRRRHARRWRLEPPQIVTTHSATCSTTHGRSPPYDGCSARSLPPVRARAVALARRRAPRPGRRRGRNARHAGAPGAVGRGRGHERSTRRMPLELAGKDVDVEIVAGLRRRR